MKLLIAEHHRPTLEHLIGLLSQAGHSVRGVGEPGAALEHFVAENPDAVVVAVDFPRLQGAHLGPLLRASEQGARVPLLVIDKGHLGKARGVAAVLDLKANGYLADPLRPGELVAKLESLVTTARASQGAPARGALATLGRPPVASGELKGFPLPALLHSTYRLRRDGILAVARGDLSRRIYFAHGSPVGYESTARQDALPRFLVERGKLTEAQGDRLTQALASGLRVGAALAEAGVEAAGEVLLHLLRDYTRDRVAQVLGMREGRYAFYAGDEFLADVARVELPALAPLLDGARRAFPVRTLAASLRPHLAEFPVRTAAFGADLTALALDTDDLKVAMQFNGRIALRDLLAHGRGDLRRGYSLLWLLKLTGGVRFSREPVTEGPSTMGPVGADIIAPRRRKPLPADTAASLREAAVRIITGSYFHGLGLDITADTEDVERAYHEVAARFHPDSYPEHDTSELQDLLDSVQDRLAASYRVLSVEEKRKAYLQYLFSRLDVGRVTAVNVDAEILLRKGEAALKRRDPRSARQLFEEAVALNPREPEYYSHLAWATYLAGEGAREERARSAQRVLKRALALNPYLERAHIISAIVDTDGGEASSARRKLLKVLELNPYSQLAKAALRKIGR
ncbi:DUF4388 domain-containing protein [Aggregicoccus sp. 17bor-14]|uniref:DUF4388 domain-containing protein n=1 Tax=Myxococcaceae TaxID=31 RepID=UPI00129C4DF0|nr:MULTISPECIES: DUF4388 domain-containing protein [Myxococcaceae]MBF5046321.1 DUF4388 domain-containing protein [Simulacricoccus sp. 17bor-14]MRI92041.1 DUF4388 domain-containing protein [Aggregicoccus sp. 17bor-14]